MYFQQKEPIKVRIWRNFTWAVKNLKFYTLMGSFCPNHKMFQLKKYGRVISHVNEEWCKVWRKTDLWFQIWLSNMNLVNFHPTTQKAQNFFSMGYFCPKHTRFELQKYGGVIFHDTEQWYKIWINPDLVVSKIAREIGWTFVRALKSLKDRTLMGSFCLKHVFQIENFIGITYHDTEGWCKI